MKRFFSIAVLIVYTTQLAAGCITPLEGDEDAARGMQRRAVTYPAPTVAADTVLPTQTDPAGLASAVLSGTAVVSASGSAMYTVPLWTPPGRDVQPNLALSYNSTGSNGLLGMGWSLPVFSQITRCKKNISLDGMAQQVLFDGSDRFCLDGQRLVTVAVASDSSFIEYRTSRDAYSRIRMYQGSTGAPYFQVQTKEGLTFTYGVGPAAILEQPLQGGGTGRLEWSLSQIKDSNGNYLSIEYQSSNTGDEHWPSAIRYTGNLATGLTPSKVIYFIYESRADTRLSFVGGMGIRQSLRLKSIDVVDNSTSPAPLLRTYRFKYTYNGLPTNPDSSMSGQSLLSELQECDGSGVCGRPTVFSYSPGYTDEGGFAGAYSTFADNPSSAGLYADLSKFQSFSSADINGDGHDDLIYRKVTGSTVGWYIRYGLATGLETEQPLHGLPLPESTAESTSDGRFVDWDGDGLMDYAGSRKNTATNAREFSFVRNVGYGTFSGGRTYQEPGAFRRSFWMPDLDGDGLPEVVHAHGPAIYNSIFQTSYLTSPLMLGGMNSFSDPNSTMYPETTGLIVDMNGSGRKGVLMPSLYEANDGTTIKLNDTYGLVELEANGSPSWRSTSVVREELADERYLFVDVNGDGLADQVHFSINGGQPRIALNTGRNGFVEQGGYVNQAQYAVSASTSTSTPQEGWGGARHFIDNGLRTADLNGDGYQDLLAMNGGRLGGNMLAFLSTGTGFKPFRTNIPGQPCSSDRGCFTSLVLDINGDGQADLLQRDTNGTLQFFIRQGVRPYLLTSVVEGSGKRVEFQHDPVSNTNVYSSSTACAHPLSCLRGGMWVVSEQRVETGDGQPLRRTAFRYENGRSNVQGLGWLGFQSRTIRDLSTGATSVEQYDNTSNVGHHFYPLQGLLLSRTTQVPLGSGLVHKFETTNTFIHLERLGMDGVRYYSVRPNQTMDSEYGPSATGPSTLLRQSRRVIEGFDMDYGNVLALRDTWNDGYAMYQEVSYQNQADTWRIGLPTRVSLTSTQGSQSQTRTQSIVYAPGTRRVTEVVREPDSASADLRLTTQIQYNGEGLPTLTTVSDLTGKSRSTSVEYDSASHTFPTVFVNALGHRRQVAVHVGLGQIAAEVDANGVTSRWQYDGFGRLRTEDGPTQADVSIEYTNNGIRTTQAGGSSRKVFFDKLLRPVHQQTQDFAGNNIDEYLHYDSLGRMSERVTPSAEGGVATSRFEYDNLGRPTRVTHPDNSFKSYSYTGLSTVEVDEKGIQRTVEDNARDWPVKSTVPNPAGGVITTRLEYGPFGVPTVSEAAGVQTQLNFDVLGRRTRIVSPDSGETLIRYNAFDEVRESVDAANQLKSYEYDALGRLTRLSTPHGADTYTWDTAPSGVGSMAESSSADGVSTAYTYDSLGRATQEMTQVQGALYSLDMGFDSFGRPSTLTYPSVPGVARLQVQYEYTPRGELKAVRNASTGLAYWQVDTRTASGHLSQATFGNGIQSHLRYDVTGNLRSIETGNGSADTQRLLYEYDATGNLQARHDAVAKTTELFGYDSLERLTRWTATQNCRQSVIDYTYSATGNLTGRLSSASGQNETYGYADSAKPHALTSSPAGAYAYDARGFQTSAPGRTVEYNTFGLPRRITRGAGDESVFTYDAFQHRVNKQRANGDAVVSIGGVYEKRLEGGQTKHTFSIMAGAGTPVALVTWAASAGTALSERVLFVHGDNQGSVESVSDIQGNVVARLKFDPFGRRVFPQEITSNATPVPREGIREGFTGQSHDDESGLIDMKGRIYDPRIGRFLTPDPLLQAPLDSQSHNRYTYVLNNPLRYTDPSGFAVEQNPGGCQGTPESGGSCWEDVYVGSRAPTILRPYLGSGDFGGIISEPFMGGRGGGGGWLGGSGASRPSAAFMEQLHFWLDIGGMSPIPPVGIAFDATNAIIYAVEGNWKEVGFSAIGAVPYAGDAFKAAVVAGKATMLISAVAAMARYANKAKGVGVAIITRYANPLHYSILVKYAGKSLHIHQIQLKKSTLTYGEEITKKVRQTLGRVEAQFSIELPNGEAALKKAKALIEEGKSLGHYDLDKNSCLNFCTKPLESGGVGGIPASSKSVRDWLYSLSAGVTRVK